VIRNKLALLAGLTLLAGGANAAIVTAGIGTAAHTYYEVGGSNGAAPAVIWGDGANAGLSPLNYCYNNGSSSPFHQCSEYGLVAAPGNNGLYWGNPTPTASYFGAVQYDDAITFVDPVDGFTYFRVTGGALQWTGTYGFEILNNPSLTSGAIGGSFFSYAFNNSQVDLTTGARQTTNSIPGAKSNCYLGAAGNVIVGSLLCGVANPVSSYQYSNVGTTYTKPANWAGVRDNGDGTMHLLLTSNRYTVNATGNNIREELNFSVVPVPAAVWLFGSALGLMGVVRRKKAAVTA
jgi:hypothetical protein